MLIKRLRLNHRTIESFPCFTPHPTLLKAYIQQFLLYNTLCAAIKKKMLKGKNTVEKTEKVSKIDSNMTEMLELSDRNLK